MSFYWENIPKAYQDEVFALKDEIKNVIGSNFVGAYIHGSLALGGFQLNSSDLDLLIVVQEDLDKEVKHSLTKLFLDKSNKHFPIEISILSLKHLRSWTHPSPFTYHYSEYWRVYYENNRLYQDIPVQQDPDLAAHLTVVRQAGIVLEGPGINMIFPIIPKEDYKSALLFDIRDGLHNIQENPTYYVLNLLRVYKYLSNGEVIGKKSAAEWGLSAFPSHRSIIKTSLAVYEGKSCSLNINQLLAFQSEMNKLLTPFFNND